MNPKISILSPSQKKRPAVPRDFIHKMKLKKTVPSQIEWYSETSNSSKHLDSLKFTNFLPYPLPAQFELLRAEIKNSLNSLSKYDIDDLGDYYRDQRRLSIVQECLKDEDKDNLEYVYKFKFTNLLDKKGSIRIYFLFDTDVIKQEYICRVFLIDPFHLVVPAAFGGRTAEQNRDFFYSTNFENKKCISNFLVNPLKK